MVAWYRFVGLENLGCICYMNATIQQLFMIPAFRKAVLTLPPPAHGEGSLVDNVVFQLQRLFAYLQDSERMFFNPASLTYAVKDDGAPTDVNIQKDASEYVVGV